jgi:hypothetical protein
MKNTIKALGMLIVSGITILFALAVSIRCLWVHRWPTASEVLAEIFLVLVAGLYSEDVYNG